MMAWFPKFLNWPAGLIAAAVFIPALLVLYFLKLRRREMPVSSTFLWKKAIQDLQVNAPFQKLRRNLLLLLQLLVLLALLLALSRPVSNYTPGPGKTTVILIDRSASMSARDQEGSRSRLEEAKLRAKSLVAGMSKNTTVMVVAFDDAAQMVQPFTGDAQILTAAIDSITPTDRKTNLKLAYQLADAQINFNPDQLRPNAQPPDVFVYSDGRVQEEGQLSIRANVKYVPLGAETAGNVAIVALSAKRNYERPTQVQVFARLANYGPEPVAAPVQLSVNGEKLERSADELQSTYLLPERWDEARRANFEREGGKSHKDGVSFTLDLTQGAVIKLAQLHKEGDQLAADDVAQVVVPPPKTLSVLLVTDGNYFLERGIKSLGLKEQDVMRPGDYEANPPTKYDVIIFDNYKPPLDPATKKTLLPDAGNFLWFGQVPDGIKTTVVLEGATTRPGGAAPAPAGGTGGGKPIILEDMAVLDWKHDHPIFKDISLAKLAALRALRLNVPLDREVLVDGLKGPMIVLDRDGKRTHLIVGFDPMDSLWPFQSSYPIFLYQALQFLAIGSDMDVRQGVEPGGSPRIPRPNLQKADPNLKSVILHTPTGTRTVPVPETGDFVLPPLDRVGIYSTEPPIPQFEQLAVNLLDPNESNLLPVDHVPGGVGEVQKADGKKRLELWWWLAVVAAGVLLVEWWVYTRRVHL